MNEKNILVFILLLVCLSGCVTNQVRGDDSGVGPVGSNIEELANQQSEAGWIVGGIAGDGEIIAGQIDGALELVQNGEGDAYELADIVRRIRARPIDKTNEIGTTATD